MNWNVWQWLIILTIVIMVVIPTIMQVIVYTKGKILPHKWWWIIGIWVCFGILIIIFSICWYITSS